MFRFTPLPLTDLVTSIDYPLGGVGLVCVHRRVETDLLPITSGRNDPFGRGDGQLGVKSSHLIFTLGFGVLTDSSGEEPVPLWSFWNF